MGFKKANGYYKHYNKEGVSCRIKIEQNHDTVTSKEDILISFRHRDDLLPDIVSKTGFKCDSDVIQYILKNLENTNMIFEVTVKYRRC